MNGILSQIIGNISVLSAMYSIVAVSFYLQYSSAKFFNMALAFNIAIGAYIFYNVYHNLYPNYLLALLLALSSSAIIALLLDFLFFRVLRQKKVHSFSFLIVSIGLYTILQNCISLYFGDDAKSLSNGTVRLGHNIFGAYVTDVQVVILLFAIIVFLSISYLFNHTKIGKQIRAISENADLANNFGISSNKIILFCTAISTLIASVTGILFAYDTNLTPTMGFNLLLYGIIAMIIGGVGNFRGLIFGSILLATAQNIVAYNLDTKWMDAVAYIFLILFLLWKPLGFTGNRLKKIEV